MSWGWIAVGAVVLLVLALLGRGESSSSADTRRGSASPRSRAKAEADAWLEDRFARARAARQSGTLGPEFSDWYFEPPTDRQLNYLDELGFSVSRRQMTKGMASDLIGWKHDAEPEDLKILRFFKVPTRGMNQTRAKVTVQELMRDPSNVQKWDERKPEPWLREGFRFFGMKLPSGIGHKAAQRLFTERETSEEEAENPKHKEWEHYLELIDQFDDPDWREDYQTKKPSMALLRSSVESLVESGRSYEELTDDPDLVVAQLFKLKPDLER